MIKVPDGGRAAERYRGEISVGTLRNWRSARIGPAFVKIGKAILYPTDSLTRPASSVSGSCYGFVAVGMDRDLRRYWKGRVGAIKRLWFWRP